MTGVRVALAVTCTTALMFSPAPAASQAPLPAKPQTQSLDSEAPPGAPPHWLPGDKWVMQHWLPYDEARLHRLLGGDRGDVWRWLRDDTRNLAGLARERGWDPVMLARALVAPWRGRLRDPGRLAELERRALRTLTQGHLAQHVFFHSLHQNAVPDNAPAIFGVATREQFQAMRRAELSPVQICRLNGLSRDHAYREARATLAATVAEGVRRQAMPAVQGRRLLGRQLRQLPRWMQQTRYNGPPPVKTPRASAATASNYSNNPALASRGGRIAYESYEAALADAKAEGEIGVAGGRTWSARRFVVSQPRRGVRRAPRSAYNPAASATGRWVAFESAEGNLNFAKRYGKMGVFVRDVVRGDTRLASPTGGETRSSYNPSISGDGRHVAFETYAADADDVELWVTDMRTRRSRAVAPPAPGTLSEARLSGTGAHLAATLSPAGGGATRIALHDLRTGDARVLDGGDGDAYEPEVSGDGRRIAFTSLASDLAPGRHERQARVFVHDVATGRDVLVAPRPGDGLKPDASASEPALSADGRWVAFAARDAAGLASGVYVHDLRTRRTELVSRADGEAGPPAHGSSLHPSISGDGRLVAFASDAWNLDRAKCNAARGIFVRDRLRHETVLASRGDGRNRYAGPTRGSSTAADMTVALVCAAS